MVVTTTMTRWSGTKRDSGSRERVVLSIHPFTTSPPLIVNDNPTRLDPSTRRPRPHHPFLSPRSPTPPLAVRTVMTDLANPPTVFIGIGSRQGRRERCQQRRPALDPISDFWWCESVSWSRTQCQFRYPEPVVDGFLSTSF